MVIGHTMPAVPTWGHRVNQISAAIEAAHPFEWQVLPERAFAHAGWERARQTVLEALAAKWMPVILGEAGSGKTLLLRELESTFRAGGLKVHFSERGDEAEPVGADVVHLVDEADALDDETLRQLAAKGRATVLAALPRFARRLDKLQGQIATVTLAPLSPAEVEEFVTSRLAPDARTPGLFTEDAIAMLASLSGGLPRMVNVLGRASLFQARLEGAPHVEARHVEAAEAMRHGVDLRDAPADEPAAPAEDPPRRPAYGRELVVVPRPDARPAPSRARRRLVPVLLGVPVLAISAWLLFSSSLLPEGTRSPSAAVEVASAPPPAPAAQQPPVVTMPDALASGSDAPASPAEAAGAPPSTVASAVLPPPPPAPPRPYAPTTASVSRPPPQAAPSSEALAPAEAGRFRGTVFNDTLGRGGGLRLVVNRIGPGDAVVVEFEAYGGLIGTGQLRGRLSRDGKLVAFGTLMMGRNPFGTELEGTISGDTLVGTARYTRLADPSARPSGTRGSFRLARDEPERRPSS